MYTDGHFEKVRRVDSRQAPSSALCNGVYATQLQPPAGKGSGPPPNSLNSDRRQISVRNKQISVAQGINRGYLRVE